MSVPERITLTVDGEALRALVREEVDRRLAERAPPARPALGAYLTPAEAADLLGYGANPERGRRRVYELVGDGRLTRHGPGRRLLVSREEVERLAAGG